MDQACSHISTLFSSDAAAPHHYSAGTDIILPGKIDRVHFLKSGFIKVYYLTLEGESAVVNLLQPDCFLPIISSLTHIPNRYFYQAILPCHTISIPVLDFHQQLIDHPRIMIRILNLVATEWHTHLIKTHHLMHSGAEGRLVHALLLLAKRFGKQTDQGTLIKLPLTHQQLADLCGLSRETVTRILQKLKNTHQLTYRKHQLLISPSLTSKLEL
jgi:CRP/FNR family transcriptional regulator, cyclic AMP receptor protein